MEEKQNIEIIYSSAELENKLIPEKYENYKIKNIYFSSYDGKLTVTLEHDTR